MTRNQETANQPAIVIIQGQHYAGSEELYEKYKRGCRPLLRKYGVKLIAIGSGCDRAYTTEIWPGCLVLQFPDVQTADCFFSDPDYVFLKKNYRDKVYEELRLSLFKLQKSPG